MGLEIMQKLGLQQSGLTKTLKHLECMHWGALMQGNGCIGMAELRSQMRWPRVQRQQETATTLDQRTRGKGGDPEAQD